MALKASELVLSVHSLNQDGRSSMLPPRGPPHMRRRVASSPSDMFPAVESFVVDAEVAMVVPAADVAAVIAATKEARSCPPGAVVGACACDDEPCLLSEGKSFLNISLAHWRALVGAGAKNDSSVT